jgi:hypothetical protein
MKQKRVTQVLELLWGDQFKDIDWEDAETQVIRSNRVAGQQIPWRLPTVSEVRGRSNRSRRPLWAMDSYDNTVAVTDDQIIYPRTTEKQADLWLVKTVSNQLK